MWWLVFPVAILLLGYLPLGFEAGFDQHGVKLFAKVGPLRLPVGAQKENDPPKEKNVKAQFESRASVKKKGTASVKRYFALVKPVLKFLLDFKRKLRVNDLQLKVVMGGGDPCDLSVNYGRAWIALGNLMPILERFFVIKKRNLEIACDYTADSTRFQGQIDVSITLGRLLQVAIYHGITILREYFKIIKQAKDGAIS